MLSLSHTPVVHTDKGPKGCGVPVAEDSFSAVKGPSFSKSRGKAVPSNPFCGRFWRRIRLARTTSVKIRSPTMISSWSRMGEGREEKYERIAVIHEYAGLNDS
jgi:hypothetical protein